MAAIGAVPLAAPLACVNAVFGACKAVSETVGYLSTLGAALVAAPLVRLGAACGASTSSALPGAAWVRIFGALTRMLGVFFSGAVLDDCAGCPPHSFYVATLSGRVLFSFALYAISYADLVLFPLTWLALINVIGLVTLDNAVRQRLQRRDERKAKAHKRKVRAANGGGGKSGGVEGCDANGKSGGVEGGGGAAGGANGG